MNVGHDLFIKEHFTTGTRLKSVLLSLQIKHDIVQFGYEIANKKKAELDFNSAKVTSPAPHH